jgi:hypothetical protein
MAVELKPCPFCGGTPELVTRNVEPQGDPWYGKKMETFVLCDCGACLFDGAFHEGFWDAETRAIAAWNRRSLQRETWMRAMEVAAKVCDEHAMSYLNRKDAYAAGRLYAAEDIGAAIRALPMPEGGE